PLWSLIEICRAFRHNLSAGLTLHDVFRQQAKRGPRPFRPIAQRIEAQLAQGNNLESALDREQAAFPPLFLSMATVGEQTGGPPEVFAELEKYFEMQLRLRRQFLAQIAWPMLSFVMAVLVIALTIWILGMLPGAATADEKQKTLFDLTGLGLSGTRGAVTFLGLVAGGAALLAGLYLLVTRVLSGGVVVDRVLLAIPVLGPTVRALGLTRFCVALRLAMERGMPITQAVRLSLRATGNGAFAACSPVVEKSLKSGDDLTEALTKSGVFPLNFLDVMAVAEESGRLHDVLGHQTLYYQDKASRRMTVLTAVAGYGVWLIVAAFIIYVIFRFYLNYIALLDPDAY